MTKRLHNKLCAEIEAKDWLIILDELRQENVVLKSRLVDALQQDVNRSFVEAAEYFQQRFIDKDQLIRLLRHDITDLLEDSNNITAQEETYNAWQRRCLALEKDMQRIVTEFSRMKVAFESYLAGKQDASLPKA